MKPWVLEEVKTIVEQRFGLMPTEVKDLNVPVNDVFEVISPGGHHALKFYNVRSRNQHNVQWELDLLDHLLQHQAPIACPVRGVSGYLENVKLAGVDRVAALFVWALGHKPQPDRATYRKIGAAAAAIHAAADEFSSPHPRETYGLHTLIDQQLLRIKPMLEQTGQWQKMYDLGRRLRERIEHTPLDTGVCHMDLTLDNVHVQNETLTVFDFDSAACSWRSIEPHGVLLYSEEFFQDWLTGYRTVRPFHAEEEQAVYVFGIVGEIRNVVWKLGFAESSRGDPLLQPEALPNIIDAWLEWEREHLLN